jgi:glycosyltransferase involved in cell wall biosynthesis
MKQPPVSITIATYNAERWIEKVLNSLFEQTYPQELVEIVVVDDGSTDKTREILQGIATGHRNLHLIFQENQGTATAHTAGLKNCRGEYIFVLSHDAYAEPNWVESVVGVFEENPPVGIVQGQVVAVREITEPFAHTVEFTKFNRSFATAAIAYRARDLDLVGRYYLEELSRFGDDAELAYRLLKHGAKSVFLEKITARHEVVPEDFWKSIKDAWGRQKFCLLFKIHPQARVFLYYGFLWGSRDRYLRTLFWPLLMLLAGAAYFYDRRVGLKWVHLLLEELVFFFALIVGSVRYQSVVI